MTWTMALNFLLCIAEMISSLSHFTTEQAGGGISMEIKHKIWLEEKGKVLIWTRPGRNSALEEKGRKLSLIRSDQASGQTSEKIIRKLCGWMNTAFIYTQSLHLLSHAIEYI